MKVQIDFTDFLWDTQKPIDSIDLFICSEFFLMDFVTGWRCSGLFDWGQGWIGCTKFFTSDQSCGHVDVSKNRGKNPQNNGKPYYCKMDDLGVPLFLETPMSGLCFIAYSLEQHDQASTKGAFVIRRAKNVMGHGAFWVVFSGRGPGSRVMGDVVGIYFALFLAILGFHRCPGVPGTSIWENLNSCFREILRHLRYWLDFCWCANFVGVTGLRVDQWLDLIWITFY